MQFIVDKEQEQNLKVINMRKKTHKMSNLKRMSRNFAICNLYLGI